MYMSKYTYKQFRGRRARRPESSSGGNREGNAKNCRTTREARRGI